MLACDEPYELASSHGPRGELVERLVRASPDHTVYHTRAYLDFVRASGSTAEVVVVIKNGELVFGFPAHPDSNLCIDGEFCGFLFPAKASARVLRRSVAAIEAFFAKNAHLRRCSAAPAVLGTRARDPERRRR